MDRDQKKQLVLDTWQAIAVGDVKAAFANLSDDIRWKIPGSLAQLSGVKNGKGEVLEFLRAASKIFPPAMRSEILTTFVDGDSVIVEMVNRSETARGHPYENEYCFIFQLADGKIREIREYVDTQRADQLVNA